MAILRLTDHCAPPNAAALAERISRFWQGKGHPAPQMVLESIGYFNQARPTTAIRSDMIGGLPRRVK